TGNTAISLKGEVAVNWKPRRVGKAQPSERGRDMALPGQGGAEKGEERPARRRVWPVAPGVPASSREAARARRGEGAALIMRRTKGNVDQGLSVCRDLGCELFQ